MDVAGLLDDMKERVRTQGATPFVGGGMRGAFLRGLLGLDPAEESTQAQVRAYQTGQALSNSPTPLALAAAPAAIVKAGKAAKAKKPLPREEALEAARKNAVEMLGLPESNTAMDRARAMGFNTLGYRGSSAHETTHAKPMWWSEDPDYASAYAAHTVRPPKGQPDPYAGNVMPLLVKIGNEKKFEKFNAGGVPDPSEVFKGFNEGVETGLRRYTNHPNLGDMSGKIWEALTIPKNVRSRFAAFDPKRINDPDLLASLAAFGVGLPVLGLLAEEE